MNLPNCKKPCKHCPFRKDSTKGWLGKERMTEILEADSFVCHKKTHLQCAGHMIIKGAENIFVRTAEAFGIELALEGKELVFKEKQKLIEHHS